MDASEHVGYDKLTNPGYEVFEITLKRGECTSWGVALPEAGMENVVVRPVDKKRIRITYDQMRPFSNSPDEWLFKPEQW